MPLLPQLPKCSHVVIVFEDIVTATSDGLVELADVACDLPVDRYHSLALEYWEKLPQEPQREIEHSNTLELA